MIKDFSFRSAILFSSLLHVGVFVGGGRLYPLHSFSIVEKHPETLEISYPHPPDLGKTTASYPLSQDHSQVLFPFPKEERIPVSEIQEREETFSSESSEEEILTGLQLTHEEKPLYLTYYQAIREKIRWSIQKHYLPGLKKGEILLTFVLFSNGKLKEVKAREKESFQDRRLKEVAVRSVIDVSPFPPFPEGLRRRFIPFRVLITFMDEATTIRGE